MKSNKGFTLIELLAVIVILAIVALVATPVILNIIESSTNKAKDSSARLVVKSVELAYTTYTSSHNGNLPTTADLKTEFNGIMDSGTEWKTVESEEKVVSGNVTCSVTDTSTTSDGGTVTVTCDLASENTQVSTKALSVAKKAS